MENKLALSGEAAGGDRDQKLPMKKLWEYLYKIVVDKFTHTPPAGGDAGAAWR